MDQFTLNMTLRANFRNEMKIENLLIGKKHFPLLLN